MPMLLLVDDNETLGRFTARNLESVIEGLEVKVASSCAQARELALRHRPDVLCWTSPADCDGLTLLPAVSQFSARTKIIVITADLAHGMRRRLLASGVFDVLTKPFEADDIIKSVRQALASTPSSDPRLTPALGVLEAPLDRHRVVNRLAGLVAGLRAFGRICGPRRGCGGGEPGGGRVPRPARRRGARRFGDADSAGRAEEVRRREQRAAASAAGGRRRRGGVGAGALPGASAVRGDELRDGGEALRLLESGLRVRDHGPADAERERPGVDRVDPGPPAADARGGDHGLRFAVGAAALDAQGSGAVPEKPIDPEILVEC